MARYIDYDRMIDFVSACGLNTKLFEMKHKDEIVEDIRPIVHAKWEKINAVDRNGNEHELVRCTNCTEKKSLPYGMHLLFDYCPYCGAIMEDEK